MLIESSAASAFGLSGSCSMHQCLHTAKIDATRNVCTQHKASQSSCWHYGRMNAIRYWRNSRGLTLQALGEAMDPPASAGTISSYEGGSRDPSLCRLQEIAKILKVTPGALLDGPPTIPSEAELATMLEIAQREITVGVSLGDYPTAVASSLRSQLQQFAGVGASDPVEKAVKGKAHSEDALSRSPTKRSARG